MGNSIQRTLNDLCFPTQPITDHGVVCTDIGDGPEIVAFQRFHPKVLFAAEPVIGSNVYTAEESTKAEVLHLLAQEIGENVQVLRGRYKCTKNN